MMAIVRESSVAFAELLCAFLGVTGCILMKVDMKQPQPYMDEIFHIPQVQQYCNGSFMEWDPMLTTPPGLYLLSIGVLHPLGWLLGLDSSQFCSVFWLRSINILFALGTLYLLRLIIRKIHGHQQGYSEMHGVVTAATLSIFPPLYFFTFLYYTDSGSTFLVLLAYLLSLHDSHKLAATVGVVSVTFRQTNVVWVAFIAGLQLSRRIAAMVRPDKKDADSDIKFLRTFFRFATNNKVSMIVNVLSSWPYITVGAMFVLFVIINGSVVLGAHSDHQVALHFPQLFYFAAFTTAFAATHLISVEKVVGFMRFIYKKPLFALVFCVFGIYVVYTFTYAHRYLLSDNRHYTFYIWARVFRRHELVKYALIPAYYYAMWSILTALQSKDILWRSIYMICLFMNLVPSMLLELRYFVLPYLIFRLNIPLSNYTRLGMEAVIYVAVNIVTLYVFMNKPFKWSGQLEEQRFMW